MLRLLLFLLFFARLLAIDEREYTSSLARAAAATKFHTLEGVSVSKTTKAVKLILKSCDESKTNSLPTKPVVECNFYLQHLEILYRIFRNPQCNKIDGISFSLDPFDPLNVWGQFYKKNYFPIECASLIKHSLAGVILFDADWDLKRLVNNLDRVADGISNYRSVEEIFENETSIDSIVRLWMSVPSIDISFSTDNSTQFYHNARLRVNAAAVIANSSSLTGLSDTNYIQKGYSIFVKHMNDHIGKYMERFRSFRQLQQLAIAQAAVKFIIERGGIISEDLLIAWDYSFSNKDLVPAVISSHSAHYRRSFFAEILTLDREDGSLLRPLPAEFLFSRRDMLHSAVMISPQDFHSREERYHRCRLRNADLRFLRDIPFNHHQHEHDSHHHSQPTNVTLFECALAGAGDADYLSPAYFSTTQFNDFTGGVGRPEEDPCVGPAVHYLEAESGDLVSLPSVFMQTAGAPRFYNLSGEILAAKFTKDEKISFNISGEVIPGKIVLLEFSVGRASFKSADSLSALGEALMLLQGARAAAVILLVDRDVVPGDLRTLPTSAGRRPVVNIPVRIISAAFSGHLQQMIAMKTLRRLMLACNISPRPAESDSDGQIDPTDADAGQRNISFGNSTYMTLDASAVFSRRSTCQLEELRLPAGFEVAPASPAVVRQVVAAYPWSGRLLLLRDGLAYGSALSVSPAPGAVSRGVNFVRQRRDASGDLWLQPAICAKILIRSLPTWQPHGGFFYRTLDAALADAGPPKMREPASAGLRVPSDWEIAPASSDVLRYLVAAFPWSADALLLADGYCYSTKNSPAPAVRVNSPCRLDRDEDGRIRPISSDLTVHILIRKLDSRASDQSADDSGSVRPNTLNALIKLRRAAEINLFLRPAASISIFNHSDSEDGSRRPTRQIQSAYHVTLETATRTLIHGGVDLSNSRLNVLALEDRPASETLQVEITDRAELADHWEFLRWKSVVNAVGAQHYLPKQFFASPSLSP